MQGTLFDVPEPAIARAAKVTSREVSDAVVELLRAAVIEGCTLLPLPPADRQVYDEFNEVLVRLRGRWKRGKGHVFPYDPTAAIAAVIESGRMPAKNPLAYFPTPAVIAEHMVELASNYGYGPTLRVLEPRAGGGSLVAAALAAWPVEHVTALELDPLNVAMLRAREWPASDVQHVLGAPKIELIEADFLAFDFGRDRFDVVLMNPPFNGDEWIEHVKRAWSLLGDVGILVSVIPLGIWRDSGAKRHVEFREWLDSIGAGVIEHAPGTFADAGTNIRTATLVMERFPERFWSEPHQGCASLPAFKCWIIADTNREWSGRYTALRELPPDDPKVRAFLRELATHANNVEQGGIPVCDRLLDQLALNWGE